METFQAKRFEVKVENLPGPKGPKGSRSEGSRPMLKRFEYEDPQGSWVRERKADPPQCVLQGEV